MGNFIDQLNQQLPEPVTPLGAAIAFAQVNLTNPHNPKVDTTPFLRLPTGMRSTIKGNAEHLANRTTPPAEHEVNSVRTAQYLGLTSGLR